MLPEDDNSRELARRLGELLDQGIPLDQSLESDPDNRDDAAFVAAMLAFKEAGPGDAEAPAPEATARMWDGIEGRLRTPAVDRRPRLRRVVPWNALRNPLRNRTGWYALAATLVVLMGFLWYLGRPPAPLVVARAEGASVVYRAPDGSQVTLRPHSRLFEVAAGEGAMRYRLVGEGYFDVVRDAGRRFEVEAADGLVTVLGTRFNVSTWGGQAVVFLEEGRVRFAQAGTENTMILEPGERSVLDASGALHEPEVAGVEAALDWMQGHIIFEQQPLYLVAAELEQHFGVILEVPPSEREESITGRILLSDMEQCLRDLATILGGRYEQTTGGAYRLLVD